MALASYMTDILESRKFFTVPMVLNSTTHVIVLVTLALLHKSLGISSALIGLLIGYFLQCVLSFHIMRSALRWHFGIRNVRIQMKVWKDIAYAQAGNAVTALSRYVPLLLLSGFGSGMISALNYATRVAELPSQLITTQFSSIVGIKFNELFSRREWKNLNRIFESAGTFLIFILMPLSGLMFVYARQIIMLLFGHGSFTESSVTLSSRLLRYLALVLPMFGINMVFAKVLMAGRKMSVVLGAQILHNAALIIAAMYGIRYLGYVGYPISRVVVYLVYVTLAISYVLKRHFPMLAYDDTLKRAAGTLLLNLAVCLPLFVLKPFLPESASLSLLTGSLIYGSVVVALNCQFNMNEEFNTLVRGCWTRIAGVMK